MVSTTKAAIAIAAASASLLSAKDIVQFDLQKHRGAISAKSVVSKDTSHNLSFKLMNQQDFYSVEVSIGTPVQKPVTLLIDTGSSDMWVNGAQACLPGTYSNSTEAPTKKKRYTSSVLEGFELTATYDSTYFDDASSFFISATPTGTAAAAAATGVNCSQYGAFNPELSSTWEELHMGHPFAIRYVDTTMAIGVYGTDSLSINGVSVPNTIFAVSKFSNSTSGVLGISFPKAESLSFNYVNGTTYNNLPQTLKADGLISKISYSVFLNSLCDKSGSLLFGAINPDWYTGELNTIPLINIYSRFSKTPIQFDVTVNGVGLADYPTLGDRKTITKTNFPGVLDTGTTLMQLPPDLAFGLADTLDFIWNDDFGYFVGGCPSHEQQRDSSIVFNFGGVNYYTPLTNFIYKTNSPNICAFVVSPFVSHGSYNGPNSYTRTDNYAILGDVLLTSMVVVYDLESYEVSLGVANYEGYASGTSDVQEIISTVPGAKKAPGYSNTWSKWAFITHYSGDESDGIFTNKGEVNPWLSTASFGCGFDPTPVTTSAFPANITLATSSLVSSVTSTGTTANVTVVTSSAVPSSTETSSVGTSSVAPSSAAASSVVTSSVAASSVAPSSAAASSVVTSSVAASSVVTSSAATSSVAASSVVTSSVVTSSVALSSAAASSVVTSSAAASSVVTSSAAPSSVVTSSAALSSTAPSSVASSSAGSSVISSSAPSATAVATSVASSAAASNATAAVTTLTVSDETTTLVTITSCKEHHCKTTTSQALVSIATLTVEGTVTQYTTYCPISGSSSTSGSVASTGSSSVVSSASSVVSSASSVATSTVSSGSSSAAPSSSTVGSSTIPSTIGTSTIGSGSSVNSVGTLAVSSTVPKPSVATSSAPANTTVSAVSSVNGVAKQIAGSFMAFAAGLVAVL